MAELTREQWEAAKARGDERLRGPRAVSARYDAGRGRVIVRLTTGIEIGFAPHDAEGLQHATRDDLAVIEVDALGLGVHFPRLDADFYVPALLEGVLGSERWMAARFRLDRSEPRAKTEPVLSLEAKRTGRRRRTVFSTEA